MTGVRRNLKDDRDGNPRLYLDRGDYGKDQNDTWWVRLPTGGGLMSLLDKALPVKEESGGRITVGGVIEEIVQTSSTGSEKKKWRLVAGEWRAA